MKYCPKCRRQYADESLIFCLEDGGRLKRIAEPEQVAAFLSADQIYEFGRFRLDPVEKTLVSAGKPLKITPKAFDTLHVLLENAGHLIEKDELLRAIWPDQFVEEGNLAYTIRLIRKALDDDADSPEFIETVPRRGYRFIGEVSRPAVDEYFSVERLRDRSPTANLVTDSRQGIYGRLVGRVKEIKEIYDLLVGDDVGLVTLTGIGGTGKTRLAREIARRIKDRFEGVYWIDLSTVIDPTLVFPTIAHSLAVSDSGTGIANSLADHFRDRSLLLILDNFEQVVSAGSQLSDLLISAPGLKLLVTSREPLRLRTETEYKVPPLGLPEGGAQQTIAHLKNCEAIQLFVQSAERARADLKLTDENVGTVAAICQKLDGLPLALELAALRTKVLSVNEILAKLENSLSLLTGGSRDMPDRQQTMRGALDWSFGLLSDTEKRTFTLLSIFEGSFTFAAAENVLANAHPQQLFSNSNIIDTVTSLTEKGLLRAERSAHGEMRFRMLVVVRDYALETLAGQPVLAAVSRSHAEYYTDFAQSSLPQLYSSEAPLWLNRFELEMDNLRAAVRWSLENELPMAASLVAALRHLAGLRLHTTETRQWLEQILSCREEIPPELCREMLTGLGIMAQYHRDSKMGRQAHEESLQMSRRLSEKKLIARDLRGIAAVDYLDLDLRAARVRLSEALEISRSIGDEFGEAAALARLGDVCNAERDYTQARVHITEALDIFKRLGYKQGIGSKLTNLSVTEFSCGNHEGARRRLSDALEISIELGDEIDLRMNFEVAAALLAEAGQYRSAARLSGMAAGRCEEMAYYYEPVEQQFQEASVERLRKAMPDEEFEIAFAEGRKMSLPEALELSRQAAAGISSNPRAPDSEKGQIEGIADSSANIV